MRFEKRTARRGFTLVEVLVCVVVLGILAATFAPELVSGRDDREESVEANLETLRSQVRLYRFQHDGRWPAATTGSEQDFADAMLLSSDKDGVTAPAGERLYGPYFTGRLPENPYNGRNDVRIVDEDVLPPADGGTGWIYSTRTGEIKANTPHAATDDGRRVEDL